MEEEEKKLQGYADDRASSQGQVAAEEQEAGAGAGEGGGGRVSEETTTFTTSCRGGGRGGEGSDAMDGDEGSVATATDNSALLGNYYPSGRGGGSHLVWKQPCVNTRCGGKTTNPRLQGVEPSTQKKEIVELSD